jgi:hypothetical protein
MQGLGRLCLESGQPPELNAKQHLTVFSGASQSLLPGGLTSQLPWLLQWVCIWPRRPQAKHRKPLLLPDCLGLPSALLPARAGLLLVLAVVGIVLAVAGVGGATPPARKDTAISLDRASATSSWCFVTTSLQMSGCHIETSKRLAGSHATNASRTSVLYIAIHRNFSGRLNSSLSNRTLKCLFKFFAAGS